jgi:precorrin-2/cobalt-factor-2 C20-methyltransferase
MTAALRSDGRLFGVGVGPGDPELLTLKAAKIISTVPVVAYFAKKGAKGIARTIIDGWLDAKPLELPLFYPLTTEVHFCEPAYAAELGAFYEEAEAVLASHLSEGRNVALICEGDPLLYGSFMHIYVRLKDRFEIEIIPGISGMSGCWSAAKLPIAWGNEVLSVVPGTLEKSALARHLATADAIVIIKVGANLGKIREAIEEAGRTEAAIYIEHGTGRGERIVRLAETEGDHAPYFSLILIPGPGPNE